MHLIIIHKHKKNRSIKCFSYFHKSFYIFEAIIDAVTHGEMQSVLHYAARYDAVESIKVLITHGAKLDCVDFLQRTPLHVAVEFGEFSF